MPFKVVVPLVILALCGCANYASRIRNPRVALEMGHYDAAIEELRELASRKDNDELLYLMDLGTAYHLAERYSEAVSTFLDADKLAEIKDYTSMSQEAVSVLLSDEVKPYKGEDFEKILINVYLALDYTLMGKWEDALVECRRVNHELDLMISKGGMPYERNAFAKYLAAVLFEARREYNDAFVDYRTVLKWMGGFPYLGIPLLRMSDRLKASQEFAEYRGRFSDVDKYKLERNEGEVLLLLELGKSPIKVPAPQFRLLPKFQKQFYSSDYAWLGSGNDSVQRVRTHTLFDIEHTAIKELDHRIGGIIAKKIGGVVLKEVVAGQVAKQTKSEALGALTSILLHATDQADLRSWTTLPARLQLARLAVPVGRYNFVLDRVTQYGTEFKGVRRWENIEVKAGQLVFLHHRESD